MTTILYLVHDLLDPAGAKRVAMLRAGGASVRLAGFHRGAECPSSIEGVVPIGLGRTRDAAFAQRVAMVGLTVVKGLHRRLGGARPDVILARNLEMLALACALAPRIKPRPRIVYETLDIHRLLLRDDVLGAGMRQFERLLLRQVSLVLTSSPAFVENYLAPRQGVSAIRLQENKVLRLGDGPAASTALPLAPRTPGSPNRIGWFGALRCKRSLQILAAFARAEGGAYEIVLRGRPAYREFDDFDATVAAAPHLRFAGPYTAADLEQIYAEVDFVWAIDFFEEGLNSSWLLPNRLYEGCVHGGVPIAQAGTQTARFLEEKQIGLVLRQPTPEALGDLLREADTLALRSQVEALDRSLFVSDRADCRALVAALGGTDTEAAHWREAA